MDGVAVAPHVVFQIILLVVQSALRVEKHVSRLSADGHELGNPIKDNLLAHLDAHYHRLAAEDVLLEVLNRFVAPVRHQDNPRETGVADVGEDGLHASGVRDVARKGPVIHGHMAVKRIDDDF